MCSRQGHYGGYGMDDPVDQVHLIFTSIPFKLHGSIHVLTEKRLHLSLSPACSSGRTQPPPTPPS